MVSSTSSSAGRGPGSVLNAISSTGSGGGGSGGSATVYGRLVPEEQLAALGRGLSVINPNASVNSTSSLGMLYFPTILHWFSFLVQYSISVTKHHGYNDHFPHFFKWVVKQFSGYFNFLIFMGYKTFLLLLFRELLAVIWRCFRVHGNDQQRSPRWFLVQWPADDAVSDTETIPRSGFRSTAQTLGRLDQNI